MQAMDNDLKIYIAYELDSIFKALHQDRWKLKRIINGD
jgi:hypothetical protein